MKYAQCLNSISESSSEIHNHGEKGERSTEMLSVFLGQNTSYSGDITDVSTLSRPNVTESFLSVGKQERNCVALYSIKTE